MELTDVKVRKTLLVGEGLCTTKISVGNLIRGNVILEWVASSSTIVEFAINGDMVPICVGKDGRMVVNNVTTIITTQNQVKSTRDRENTMNQEMTGTIITKRTSAERTSNLVQKWTGWSQCLINSLHRFINIAISFCRMTRGISEGDRTL